jgi:hypothetical protein
MMTMKLAQVQYSEHDAAIQLGVSVDELRKLVRCHIVKDEDEDGAGAPPTYKSSDLVLLRILARMTPVRTQVA